MPNLYCRSCWRESDFQPAIPSVGLRVVYVLATLGLGLFLKPYRCSACGQLKFAFRIFDDID